MWTQANPLNATICHLPTRWTQTLRKIESNRVRIERSALCISINHFNENFPHFSVVVTRDKVTPQRHQDISSKWRSSGASRRLLFEELLLGRKGKSCSKNQKPKPKPMASSLSLRRRRRRRQRRRLIKVHSLFGSPRENWGGRCGRKWRHKQSSVEGQKGEEIHNWHTLARWPLFRWFCLLFHSRITR